MGTEKTINIDRLVFKTAGEVRNEKIADKTRVNLVMDSAVVDRLKTAALDKDTTVAEIIRVLVFEWLDICYGKAMHDTHAPGDATVAGRELRIVSRNTKMAMWYAEIAKTGATPNCAICGGDINDFEDCQVDHITPWSKGGGSSPSNLQLTHKFCNMKKGGGHE